MTSELIRRHRAGDNTTILASLTSTFGSAPPAPHRHEQEQIGAVLLCREVPRVAEIIADIELHEGSAHGSVSRPFVVGKETWDLASAGRVAACGSFMHPIK